MSDDWQKADLTPTWDFDQKKMLTGIFISKKENVGKNQSNLYNIKTDEGVVSIWGSALLNARFDNITEGEEVVITYRGKKTSERTGRQYKDFEVLHREVKSKVQDEDIDPNEIQE